MDECCLDKVMWDTAMASFREHDALARKIAMSLSTAHRAALKEALANRVLKDDLQRVQFFMKTWMENSLGKLLASCGTPSQVLTREAIVQLFSNLVAPFGESNPFSCVPAKLTQRIGRPPKTWSFLDQTAVQLLRFWTSGSQAPCDQRPMLPALPWFESPPLSARHVPSQLALPPPDTPTPPLLGVKSEITVDV